MRNQPLDDSLKELEIALAIEPSPGFEASVRAKIAQNGGRLAWPAWQWMAAAAMIAITVFGAGVWRLSVAGDRAQPQVPVAHVPDLPVAGDAAQSAVAARDTPTAKARPVAVPPRVAVAPALEVLVAPDQAIALNQLLAALRERQMAARRAGEAPTVVIEELPQISPVRLEPIKIDPLVPNSPSSGGKEKDR